MPFEPKSYWEERLRRHDGLLGVGFTSLGSGFNERMYAVRREVFCDAVRALPLDLEAARVLDVGSGSGFYLDRWQELGAAEVSGVDLTDVAVERLRERHPGVAVLRADIGDEAPAIPGGPYDAVSIMDVLFHVVDETRWQRAIANLTALVRPGGYLLIADNFPHDPPASEAEHVRQRTLGRWRSELAANGMQELDRRAMFVLMNAPVDRAGPLRRGAWLAIAGTAHLHDRLGGAVGTALLPLERRLVRGRSEGPSTELMICRKLPAPS